MILLKLKESMSYFKLSFNKPTNYVKIYFFECANNLFTFFLKLSELPGAAGNKLPTAQKAPSGAQAVAAGGDDDDLQAR